MNAVDYSLATDGIYPVQHRDEEYEQTGFATISGLVISGQILADPFVGAFLGLSVGMVLSLARVPLPFPARVAPIAPAAPGDAWRERR